MEGELVGKYATIDQVDNAILRRYLELVETANPEDLAKLLESWAKYIAARRNSDVFEKGETPEERKNREEKEAIMGAIIDEQDS